MPFSKDIFIVALTLSIGCDYSVQKDAQIAQSSSAIKPNISADSLLLDQQRGLVFYRKKPFTGTAIVKYPNDTVASIVEYVNGKKEGVYRKGFSDGKLSFEASYLNGKRNGKSYSWWHNGNLRTEANFVDGIPDGVQLQYYKSGVKFKKINLVAGREAGLQQSWRENGKLYNNYEAKNGRIFGLKRAKLCFELDDEEVQYQK